MAKGQSVNILVIHGPNLNMLGVREPVHYGHLDLTSINQNLQKIADKKAICIDFFQNNVEGVLVERIHQAYHQNIHGIVINPAAYTHTSIAIRDALLATQISFVEVHLSNVYQRESFRHHSMLSDIAVGIVAGFGSTSYDLGLQALTLHLQSQNNAHAKT